MENTGRIQRTLTPTARRIVLERGAGAASLAEELSWIARVDRAHLVMLAETGLVERRRAALLLDAISGLVACGFAPLAGRPAPRGPFLLYEDFLRETLGDDIGGVLQTGRSRNDLNATVLQLRLRTPFRRLVRELLRLQAVLIKGARRHAGVVMPIYTHYQAALPTTWGHYLAGVACALRRDLAALLELAPQLDACPLGAGAAGGTTLPLDTARTAALLGFSRPVVHSLDAVASRDLVLRLLSAAAVLGVTLGRAASDLLLWSSGPFGFLEFPDSLVGSSSMMPQKRNAFLLEHVQGRSALPLGAFASAAAAMQSKPFSNSIAVGTEGVAPVWEALRGIADAAVLLRLSVHGARPHPAAMEAAAACSYTTATELANRAVLGAGLSFREAHRRVGAVVTEAQERGEALAAAAARWIARERLAIDLAELDPASVARASEFGGGPGPGSLAVCLRELHAHWAESATVLRTLGDRWSAAEHELAAAVGCLEQDPADLEEVGCLSCSLSIVVVPD